MTRRQNLTSKERADIIRRFSAGEKATALAAAFNCERTTIYVIARKARNGSPLRPQRPRRVATVGRPRNIAPGFSDAECRRVVFQIKQLELPTPDVSEMLGISEDQIRKIMARWYGDHECYGPITEADAGDGELNYTTVIYDYRCKTDGCKYHVYPFATNLHPSEAFCPCCRVRVIGLEPIGKREITRARKPWAGSYI